MFECENYDKSTFVLIEFVPKQFWRWYEKIAGINRIYDLTINILNWFILFQFRVMGLLKCYPSAEKIPDLQICEKFLRRVPDNYFCVLPSNVQPSLAQKGGQSDTWRTTNWLQDYDIIKGPCCPIKKNRCKFINVSLYL